jgi:NTE family protein
MRFGLRIDNENQTQISIDLRDENLIGTGTELGLIVTGGMRNMLYRLEHKANRIFNTYLTYKIQASYEHSDIYTYKDDVSNSISNFSRSVSGEYRHVAKSISLGIGTQVERFGNLILEGKYAYDEIKNKKDFFSPYTADLISLKLSSTIDSQDKYPFPDKGFLIKTSYETAQKLLGGDISYTKFIFDYRSYFTFHNAHTISPIFTLGFADNTLPLGQQFSLGGQNSFFGLRDYEYRGRQIFLTSLQYRYKLPFQLFFDTFLKLRYDLGWIWPNREDIKFGDLHHGTGATLSFKTPLGPADFSIGRSFLFYNNPNSSGSSVSLGPVYFYFTIGYYY